MKKKQIYDSKSIIIRIMKSRTKGKQEKKPNGKIAICVGLLLVLFALAFHFYGSSPSHQVPIELNQSSGANTNNISDAAIASQGNNSADGLPSDEPATNQTPFEGSGKSGAISVISDPTGAAVFVDTVAYGSTPLTFNLPVGSHILDLKKPGYHTYRAQVLINSSSRAYLNASMLEIISTNETSNNSVQTGSLSIYSNPAKATILIDGRVVGANNQTPAVYYNITSDYHTISFEKSGYVPYSTKVYVASGILNLVEVNLTAIDAQFGTLNITTTPEQAQVYLDDNLIGTTPMIYNATVDYHLVRLEKEGYFSYAKRVYTNANKVIDLNVTLLAKN